MKRLREDLNTLSQNAFDADPFGWLIMLLFLVQTVATSEYLSGLVEGTTPADILPEEIASQYTHAGKTRWLDVYVSDRVWFP